jgi:hypothetical protein
MGDPYQRNGEIISGETDESFTFLYENETVKFYIGNPYPTE